ncbi:unnamed protein product [Caenorhabditis sp. 36 PRJEB53466]|nr:unnamed protein product [Caenorhabditis sp. 36 PRJEB53466]
MCRSLIRFETTLRRFDLRDLRGLGRRNDKKIGDSATTESENSHREHHPNSRAVGSGFCRRFPGYKEMRSTR